MSQLGIFTVQVDQAVECLVTFGLWDIFGTLPKKKYNELFLTNKHSGRIGFSFILNLPPEINGTPGISPRHIWQSYLNINKHSTTSNRHMPPATRYDHQFLVRSWPHSAQNAWARHWSSLQSLHPFNPHANGNLKNRMVKNRMCTVSWFSHRPALIQSTKPPLLLFGLEKPFPAPSAREYPNPYRRKLSSSTERVHKGNSSKWYGAFSGCGWNPYLPDSSQLRNHFGWPLTSDEHSTAWWLPPRANGTHWSERRTLAGQKSLQLEGLTTRYPTYDGDFGDPKMMQTILLDHNYMWCHVI